MSDKRTVVVTRQRCFHSELMDQLATNGFPSIRRERPKSAFLVELQSRARLEPFWGYRDFGAAAR